VRVVEVTLPNDQLVGAITQKVLPRITQQSKGTSLNGACLQETPDQADRGQCDDSALERQVALSQGNQHLPPLDECLGLQRLAAPADSLEGWRKCHRLPYVQSQTVIAQPQAQRWGR